MTLVEFTSDKHNLRFVTINFQTILPIPFANIY